MNINIGNRLITCLTLVIILITNSMDAMKVSFYGDGYITMPLQEAKMSTNIRIKFRTRQENAFLFLADGRTDYCLIRLDGGIINFTFKIDRDVIQLISPKKHILNDLEWHDIAIQRYDSNITLQVDSSIIRKSLKNGLSAFNVHYGTYLGGVGEFRAEYVKDVNNFRGCISDVFYNNINIIKRAKERIGHTTSIGVSWTCSYEFDADVNEPISFLNDDSFGLLLKEKNPSAESILFDIRTIEPSGLVFFNGGYDYILVEIQDSILQLFFNKGGTVLKLSSNNTVSDGQWHQIHILYDDAEIEFSVDNATFTAMHPNVTNSTIQLEKSFFIGGVPEKMRRKLLSEGLKVTDLSLKGCMRAIMVNDFPIGFPQMRASNKLSVDCVWKYPCIEERPCLLSGVCNQWSVDEFICYCDQAYCIKADYQGPFKIFSESGSETELLNISPLQLLEGGTIFITALNIDLLFEIKRQEDIEIRFNIVQQPKYGTILQFSPEKNNFIPIVSFGLDDLSTDKLKYVHNGAESFNDHATIDMQIEGPGHKVPEYILGKHRFLLHANITPVNDPPQLRIPRNKILRLIEGIEKVLTNDLFSIEDPDSPSNVLIYSILPTKNLKENEGQFAVDGKPSETFSQTDIDTGSVTYLYNATTTETISFNIMLQVSDGVETSDAVNLPVSVHPLELRLVNNTGLIMIHKSFLFLTPFNLSIETNSGEDNIDIRYDIVKRPQYGAIQRLRQVDSSWVNVEWFRESQLLLSHVRYIHNIGTPWQDEFKFVASHGLVTTQTFDFRITFTSLRITSSKQPVIAINGSNELIFNNEVLLFETVPLSTFPRNIIYKIIQPTKYGSIFVEGSRKVAKEMDSFTQLDVDKNRIRYALHRTSYSYFVDYLDFMVSVMECDNVIGKLKIIFTPKEELKKKLSYQTKQILRLQEGDRALINKNNFEIAFNIYESLNFSISIPPQHGTLCHQNTNTSKLVPMSDFTLEQLFLNEVYYCHDDTESQEDTFSLLILSNKDADMQFICQIDAQIKLSNDNPPYRTVDKTFHVVRGSFRTINQEELQYMDADINTNLSDIHYIHVSSTNGEFYKSGINMDCFSQDDINNRRIIFQHSGPDIGTASFIVSDGQYESTGILEIHASEPFVSMLPTNATTVQEGKFVILRNRDFVLETNLDIKLDGIHYEVITPPSYGILMYLGRRTNDSVHIKFSNLTSLNNFTHLDVERDRLVYWNTEVASMDKIRYRVFIKNTSAEGEVIFRVYPSAYWENLQIKKNQTLYVEESTSVLLSRDILEVSHPNISPGDITFLVTTSPIHGYLEMQSMSFDDEYNCKVFDQSAINTNKMFYIQAGVNQSSDYFVFDVTNGITWLRNLMLKIIIIPERLYMTTNAVIVVEGKTTQISATDIQPFSEYYKNKILEYKITESPFSGFVMAGNSKVKRFTQKQLELGTIQYVHNGNENSTDSITLIALARSKESVPFVLNISVIPVNDEIPYVAINTGLQVWHGGKYTIKSSDLMAQDYDTTPENLTFIVNHIYGGFLALKEKLNMKIHQFTQGQVNNEVVQFIHDGNSQKNEISFIVTDGAFNTTDQILNIAIKPVIIIKEYNVNLHVFPLTKKQILRDHLSFKCSDIERKIKYNITIQPNLGRILHESIENGHTAQVNEFTQEDIDNGRIFYEHTAVILELRVNDSFYFDIIAEESDRLFNQKFNIEISVSSGGLLRFLPVPQITVDEGGIAPIRLDFTKIYEYLKTRAGINNAEVYIEVLKKPNHGQIGVGNDMKSEHRISTTDFSKKNVFYEHDHTDTLEDEIFMSVYLSQGIIFLCNLSIPVTVTPINDQPFKLMTHAPQMVVVESENRTITKQMLLTEDKDTAPEDIFYEVTSGPTLGVLKKTSSDEEAQELIVHSNQFTQADINNNRITYVHFGAPQSTTFCFTVTDGHFDPAYEIFTIKVDPITILPTDKQTPVLVPQGGTTATLQVINIGLKTNVKQHRLLYNITNSPLYGIIVLKHQPTLRFTQDFLENSQISYMQTDLSRSNDTFQVYAYVPNTKYGAVVDVMVLVEPIIKINDILLQNEERVRLETSLIADSQILVKMNKLNAKFLITRTPSSGQIRKIIRSSGDFDNQNQRSTISFSYKELRSGVIYFVPYERNSKNLRDIFEYSLIIKAVQPAQGVVNIDYHTEKETTNLTTAGSGKFSLNYIGVVYICIVIFIIILIGILAFKLRCLKHKKINICKEHPPALPCPPDLTSVSPTQNYNNSEIDSIPVTAASTPLPCFSNIPHCKVIRVESYKVSGTDFDEYDNDYDLKDDQREIEHMVPNQYQHSYPDNDAWSSSCDMTNDLGYSTVKSHQPSSNPLLRRNQYWV
ncbi:chondroitin sulfate proteoglycan 4 [Episyrphus balteatus]|uniref:chondroitin sulfate proteoglycan 4 n=1 Tax=Episyrphus balteatus TaxID=286459 RepID=UPI00248594A9|nr:chondroitin sulfate proteoglycan 4 [Episyrphus balteatus]XP_055851634.1 chondroitin sulfate proteoglycan 4 [Episyrphus balteatus]XP_055851644.1 chondroitin sulfate proteoglycan 4 [Episyrphus balteatus]XP_055851650.1 chondroitin sulfate proteoglycan 4 [Episyrphus balteatus]XP_055851656.1 chondroitin sulfate proteoglycan 4 [Episyrphus balteatus]